MERRGDRQDGWVPLRRGTRARLGRRLRSSVVLGVALGLGPGCALPGISTDFTSISHGKPNEGRLRRPKRMPRHGRGFLVPETWRTRGNQYGVEEMVAMVTRAAGYVRKRHRKRVLGVADLSPKAGGSTMFHKSHQSGRDVDLIFYSLDPENKPLPPPSSDMVPYDGAGKPMLKPGGSEPDDNRWADRRFDSRANWTLIEALLSDPDVRVQWIFVSDAVKGRLLRYARRTKQPQWLIEYADLVMKQPGPRAPHDDHFHVRIYCPRSDRELGCRDLGPVWAHEKKTWKYGGPERYDPHWRRHALPDPAPGLGGDIDGRGDSAAHPGEETVVAEAPVVPLFLVHG